MAKVVEMDAASLRARRLAILSCWVIEEHPVEDGITHVELSIEAIQSGT